MNEALKNKIKVAITVLIIGLFLWFLVISPMIMFHKNEKSLEEAARRYYELNSNELPTGERVKTLKLSTLYSKAFLEDDFKVPYTNKICSQEKSWVKVQRVNNEFKYYVYLECGVLSSTVDHKGPEIKLVGDSEITISKGDKYKEAGVKSVVDNSDGKLNVKDVTIKGNVDTSKIGTYEVTYTAFDKLKNEGTVTRKVNVVQKLGSTVKKATAKNGYYVGENVNNYIYFSNMVFRIVNVDGNKVKIVADKDIANVNYNGIEEWFKYYEKHLSDSAKKLIVPNKYCNTNVSDTATTKCSKYSGNKKFGLLSVIDVNNSMENNASYLTTTNVSWLGNAKDNKNAYVNSGVYINSDSNYAVLEKVHNLGVRPVITIDGNLLIKDGDGTVNNPYKLEDYVEPEVGANVNTRLSGEFIQYGGILWRIIEANGDGTTRIISEASFDNITHQVDTNKNIVYNPTQKGNAGYFINNKTSEYVETRYFVNKNIKVPIYSGEPNYGKEKDTKTYKVKISAPNMYDMFAATTDNPDISSFWFVNSTTSEIENPGMSETGVVMFGEASRFYDYGIRPVANLHKDCVITSGKGTVQDPYIISK